MKKSYEEQNLEIMSKTKNYNKWIYSNIKPYLGSKIVEIGAGIGNMTRLMLGNNEIVATDVSKKNLKYLNSTIKSDNCKIIYLDLSKGIGQLKKGYYDTVVIINVLEHIKDDISCIENSKLLLKKSGKLILVLPAYQFAYGTIDESDSHYRRYDKSFIPQLKKLGFTILKSRHMNLPGLLGWIWHGKILKLKVHKENDLTLFDKLVPLFSFCEKIIPFLPGLSLIVICEKK